jgi:hypothetical protein
VAKTFTETSIDSAWVAIGVRPFNLQRMLESCPAYNELGGKQKLEVAEGMPALLDRCAPAGFATDDDIHDELGRVIGRPKRSGIALQELSFNRWRSAFFTPETIKQAKEKKKEKKEEKKRQVEEKKKEKEAAKEEKKRQVEGKKKEKEAAKEEKKRQVEEKKKETEAAKEEKKRQAEEKKKETEAAKEEKKRQVEEKKKEEEAAKEEKKRQLEEKKKEKPLQGMFTKLQHTTLNFNIQKKKRINACVLTDR